MASNLIGHTTCPECGNKQAEVKRDKKGNPYRVCFECDGGSQYFTLGKPGQVAALMAKTRPLAADNTPAGAPVPAPADKAPAGPVAKPAAPKKPAAPAPEPVPEKKRSTWTTILGAES